MLYHKRVIQLLLRVFAVILSYLLLTNFSIRFTKTIELSSPVLLLDFSPSMKNHLKEMLSAVDSMRLICKKIFFSESVYSDTNGIKPRFTNITGALRYSEKLNPSGIILVSDGNHNFGPAPDEILDNFKTPIYCFAAGHKSINDQSIVNVFYSDYAFRNDTVRIEVVIESQGLGGKIGRVGLKYDEIEIAKDFRLSEEIARQSIEFGVVPNKVGKQKFNVTLKSQVGESDYNNNEFNFSIKILERKILVLYYTDHPSFNTQFIINSLKKNIDIEYSEIVRISKDKILTKGRFVDNGNVDLKQFDIIILDNIDGNLNWNLNDFLNSGKGILIVGNISGMNNVLNEILPFPVTGSQLEEELRVKILSPFSVLSPKEEYAPVSRINRALGINPHTKLIARAGEFPLIAYRKVGNGFVFQINVSELGVWHFTQLNLSSKDILNPLIEDVLRFLSPYAKNQRLLLKTEKNRFQIGEQIKIQLRAYDQNLLPGSGGEFYLNFQDKKIPFFEIKPGIYETSFFVERPGEFVVFATGNLNNDTLKSNELNLKVIEVETEPVELINEQLLEKIALKTNGKYYDISQLKEFDLTESQKRYEFVKFSFDRPIFYFLIFILILIDWIIRKKGGLV